MPRGSSNRQVWVSSPREEKEDGIPLPSLGSSSRLPSSSAQSSSAHSSLAPSDPLLPSTSSKKRDRDDEDLRSTSVESTALNTPHLSVIQPPPKRMASELGQQSFSENDEGKIRLEPESSSHPGMSRWNDLLFASYIKPSTFDKLANFPIPPQEPITVFPAAGFGWPPVGHQNVNGMTAHGHGPSSSGSNSDRIAIDPALSSVRSSALQVGLGEHSDIKFRDETLASATASPGGLDAAMGDGTPQEALGEGGDYLDSGDNDESRKDQPFSRSPELRVSHKLAERKRRKEMKDLFDELRDLLPAERGTKSSKWEILSKAIDFITQLKTANGNLGGEIDKIRREVESARGQTSAPYQQGAYHSYQIPPTYPPSGQYPPAGTSGAAQPTSSPNTMQQVSGQRSDEGKKAGGADFGL